MNKLSSCYDRVIPFLYSSFLLAFVKEEKYQFLTPARLKCMLCELPTLSISVVTIVHYSGILDTVTILQGKKKVDIQR